MGFTRHSKCWTVRTSNDFLYSEKRVICYEPLRGRWLRYLAFYLIYASCEHTFCRSDFLEGRIIV